VGYDDGEAVGRVVGLGDLPQVQEAAHHLLHLPLVRPSVGRHPLLALQRGVLGDLYPGPVRRQEGRRCKRLLGLPVAMVVAVLWLVGAVLIGSKIVLVVCLGGWS
jgi:hypothetical protein